MHYRKNVLAIAAAAILISSVLVPVGFLQKAEAATIDINTDTTWTNMSIGAADVVNIHPGATLTINGQAIIEGTINVGSKSALEIGPSGKLVLIGSLNLMGFFNVRDMGVLNVDDGQLNIKGGTLNVDSGVVGGTLLIGSDGFIDILDGGTINVSSLFTVAPGGRLDVNSGSVVSTTGLHVTSKGTLDLESSLNLNNGGALFANSGGTLNLKDGADLMIASGSLLGVGGTINVGKGGRFFANSGGTFDLGGTLNTNTDRPLNVCGTLNVTPGGKVNDNSGMLNICSDAKLYVDNSGTVNLKVGTQYFDGLIDVNGLINISNTLKIGLFSTFNVNSGGKLKVNPAGIVELSGKLVLKKGGALSNAGAINQQCGGTFTKESGSTFIGDPVVDVCITFPITHMSDTTVSSGTKLSNGGNTISGERVTSTSQIKGDKIDQITIRLKKSGAPTGNAIIGVFSSTGALKKQFAAKDVSTLTTTFKDYTFSLTGGQLYTIASGDRIGIKYTGGSSINGISVMRDTNVADPFDGTKTDLQQFKAGVWSGINTNDMYMILRQTHA